MINYYYILLCSINILLNYINILLNTTYSKYLIQSDRGYKLYTSRNERLNLMEVVLMKILFQVKYNYLT